MRVKIIKLIGGPLDGEEFDGIVFSDEPYIVLEARCNESRLFCMYKLENDCLKFIGSKTYEQVIKNEF
jgi:hypothetical protein